MIWLKRLGLLATTLLVVVVLLWVWLMRSDSGAAWLLGQARSALGGALQVERIGGNLHSGVRLQNTRWRGDGAAAQVQNISARAALRLWPLRLRLSDVAITDAGVQLDSSAPAPPGAEIDVDATLNSLALPIAIEIDQLQLRNLSVQSDGELIQRFQELRLSAEWAEQLKLEAIQLRTQALSLNGSGSLGFRDNQPLSLRIAVEGYGFATHSFAVDGERHGGSYRFDALAVDGKTVSVSGHATVDWEGLLTVAANLSFSHLQLHEFAAAWPEDQSLVGNVELIATESAVDVARFELAAPGTAAELSGSGRYDISAQSVSGTLAWSQLQWPLIDESPDVASRFATLRLDGSFDDWRVDGDIAIATRSTPEGELKFQARGDRNQVAVDLAEGKVIGGAVSGAIAYSWRDTQLWSADLAMAAIAVGEVLPDWPGVLSGRVAANGSVVREEAQLRFEDVTGRLRDRPLKASGELAVTGNSLRADELQLRYGNSSALLSGAPEDSSGLRFDVEVNELREFVADAQGAFVASGRYWLTDSLPRLAVDLRSESLRVDDIEIDNIVIRDRDDGDALLSVDIEADAVRVANEAVTQIVASTRIDDAEQTIEMQFVARDTTVQLAVAGALDDFSTGLDAIWQGQLTRLSIKATDEHEIQLADPATLELSQSRVVLDTACFVGSLGSQICGEGRFTSARDSDGRVELTGLPLGVLDQFMSTELEMDQQLGGLLEWQYDKQRGLTASGNLALSAGQMRSLRKSNLSLRTGPGRAEFDVENGTLLSGLVQLSLPDSGRIDGHFSIDNVAAGANSSTSGVLNVAISDIAMLAHFSPLMDTANGNLQAQISLAGTVANPLMTGEIVLRGGQLEYLPIGLDLTDINLQAELRGDRNTNLQGTFRAGDGIGQVKTIASFRADEALALEFNLSGESLTLIDVPDLRAVVDTELSVVYEPQKLTLDGEVLVSEARVRPTNLVNTAVTESDDVVIVAGQLQEAANETDDAGSLNIFGDLTLALGDDVSFDVSVARATASGSAQFSWSGDPMPTANGRYDLRGQVQAFGQVLDITEGRVGFSDVAADNPYLRIRAEREIFGNTQVKKAGVFIDGSASNPRVETYTTPLTTEERALTLLATGSDFDYEQGVGAVDFGTYIAPRLFVSYGVSLFGQDNVISARYDLSKGFGIKATSGSTESGVDLNYRFEN